jgi:chromosome partitioning protein
MFILSLTGQKGGTGKSSFSLNLEGALAPMGYRVVIVDTDGQGSSLRCKLQASRFGHYQPDVRSIDVFEEDGQTPRDIRPDLRAIAAQCDVLIVDTAGRESAALSDVLLVSDLTVVPVIPSPLDVWALDDTIKAIHRAKRARPRLAARMVLNTHNPRTLLSRAVAEALRGYALPLLESSLEFRYPFRESFAEGQAITRYAPGSKAAEEVITVALELAPMLPPPPNGGLRRVA